jgi:hypothetical protein
VSDGEGRASRLVPSLAIGAAVAAASVGGRMLLERRRVGDGNEPDEEADGASANDEPPDLATELRGAAEDLALALLDRASARLEHANR